MIPVKICGITSFKDAEMVVKQGASAIGMIFYENSLRYIHPDKVKGWISDIPEKVKKVGVFVNAELKSIISISNLLDLDYIQLHGDESPSFCDKMNKPVIKVFRIDKTFSYDILKLVL